MNPNNRISINFFEWIDRSLDGSITPEEFEMMDHEIATNQEACDTYLEFITTYVSLVDQEGFVFNPSEITPDTPFCDIQSIQTSLRNKPEPSHSQSGPFQFSPNLSEDEKTRLIESYARQKLQAFLEHEHQHNQAGFQTHRQLNLLDTVAHATQNLFGAIRTGIRLAKTAAIITLVASALLLIGLGVYSNRTVATLIESADAQWEIPPSDEGNIKPHSMTLEQGYARIRLNKGAEVILQAPTTFKVNNANKMQVDSGWVTASVPKQAIGFTIQTPGPEVIDYGTEFGLMIGMNHQSEVHVFDGEIGLAGVSKTTRNKKQFDKMTQGQAATIDSIGDIDQTTLADRPNLFVRKIPKSGFGIPGKRLGLADMVAGGNGLNRGVLGRGISPTTGEITAKRTMIKSKGNGFIETPDLMFVNGVFVPDANQGPVKISTTGVLFNECPKTNGLCFESLNNGATFQAGSSGVVHDGMIAGVVYEPSIGMHPNSGITFDLRAVRSAMSDIQISGFHTLCGVSDTVKTYFDRDWPVTQVRVDFWVLVDGHVRYMRTMHVGDSEPAQISIPLTSSDRFLTLATTHPNEYAYGWAIFAQPALMVKSASEAASQP